MSKKELSNVVPASTVSAHFNGCYFTGLKNTFLGTSRDCDFNETICPAHNIRFSMMKIEGSNAEERTKNNRRFLNRKLLVKNTILLYIVLVSFGNFKSGKAVKAHSVPKREMDQSRNNKINKKH